MGTASGLRAEQDEFRLKPSKPRTQFTSPRWGEVNPPLHRRARVEVDRIERGLAADIEPVAARAAETDVGDDFPDRYRAEMRAIRRVAEHAAASRRPYVAMDVAAE